MHPNSHPAAQLPSGTVARVVQFPNSCTRCGRCCREEVCRAGEAVYKTSVAPCPGLEMNGAVASCGLLKLCPTETIPFFTMIMGFGVGCRRGTVG